MAEITLPPGFDWRPWVARWDRMQERYNANRAERFDVMARLVRATLAPPMRILDLGCGPGSLALSLLESVESAQVVGVDYDPSLLLLARERTARYGGRVTFVLADMRQPSWTRAVSGTFDAVVSATALNWLSEEALSRVYLQIGLLVRPGGIVLNADHVGSECAAVQAMWDKNRQEFAARAELGGADDWHGFWTAYGRALGIDVESLHRAIEGKGAGGIEQGLPLAWHLHALKAAGFRYADCFWRQDGDAVYGGVRVAAAHQ